MSRPIEYENLIKTRAYEGYFQLVQAIMACYAVRAKEAGRNLMIQRVSTTLGVSPQEFAFVTRAHERRNGTAYHSPFPPVSRAEALAMLDILARYLPIAHILTDTPQTTRPAR